MFKLINSNIEVTKEEKEKLDRIKEKLEKKESMLDWLDIETCISDDELSKIDELTINIRKKYDVMIVIGIGGSILGSKGVVEALSPYFEIKKTETIYVGHNLSSEYLNNLLEYINNKEICILVVSKSGETREVSTAFNIFYHYLKDKYSNYKERTIIVTGKRGSLREFSIKENLLTFDIPENIGGRFSTFTFPHLLVMAVNNVDYHSFLNGARSKRDSFNEATLYALNRYRLENKNYCVESLTFYEEKLKSLGECLEQLLAETEGKDKKGVLPIVTINTTKLHSVGQYFQEGRDIVFETVFKVNKSNDYNINEDLTLHTLNNIVVDQVIKAHELGNTPNILFELDEICPYTLGEVIYFFQLASAIGGYLLDIDPFNQPGVESYKRLVNEYLENINK